jgi:hypothetical protein
VGEEGEYTLDESLTEGKRVYCSQTDKSPEVTTRLEREREEEKEKGRGERKNRTTCYARKNASQTDALVSHRAPTPSAAAAEK